MTALFFLLFPVAAFEAECQAHNIDGTRYYAFARSLETGRYYAVTVVFEGNHANVHFGTGKSLELTLDEQTVEDPEEVVANDSEGRCWALSIDGLGEPANGSTTLPLAESQGRKTFR